MTFDEGDDTERPREAHLLADVGDVIRTNSPQAPNPHEGADVSPSQQLRRAHDLLQFHLDNSPLALLRWDRELRVVNWSKRAEALFGWTKDEVFGKRLTDFPFIHPEDAPRVMSILSSLQCGTPSEGTNMNRNYTKDGRVIYCEWHNSIYLDAEGNVDSVFSLAEDVTERRQADEALREVTARLQGILDNSPLLIADIDSEGRYRVANQAICDLLGRAHEELIGQRMHAFLPPETVELFMTRLQKVRETRAVLNVEDHVQIDGSDRTLETVLFPLLDDDENITSVGSISHDVTERRVAERERENLAEQLRQSQKLEAVGQLAGGVAHDYNNMLGVILGHADMVLEGMPPSDLYHGHLVEIRKAAQRSAKLTHQLLVFARKQAIVPKVLDLNCVVESVLEMLRHLIGEDVELIWKPEGQLGRVRVDASQMDQLLANLVVNARDAIAGTGTITIWTANVEVNESYCETRLGAVPGKYVLLSISDNGCGMDKEIQTQIFEPFFTTKLQGQGTGLGLATVYGIVKQSHGFLEVESSTEKGATFRIFLPRELEETLKNELPITTTQVVPGSETILLVEDEPALLKLASWQLERLGYNVLQAGSPQIALEVARQHPGEIQLLVTDVIMPEMNGRDLWRKLSSEYPRMKGLFISGYTADVIAKRGVLEEGVHFLQKPFSKDALARKVRDVLNDERTHGT